MFPCTQRHLHSEEGFSVLPGCTEAECIPCMINHLKDDSVSVVQKQVCLTLLQSLVVESNGNLILMLQEHIPICHQLVDLYMTCVSVIHCLQLESIFDHLLSRSKQKLKELDEVSIKFSLGVLTRLQSLSEMYSDIVMMNHDDIVSELLTKAEFMEEEALDKLVLFLTFLLKRILSMTQCYGNETSWPWSLMLNEQVTMWLNTIQSVNLCQGIVVLAKEIVRQKNAVNNLLHLGDNDYSQEDLFTGHALNSRGFSFVLGIKRILALKDETLTITAVECITLMMDHITQREQVQTIFDSDLPGIEAVVKTVQQMMESERYAIADLGMDLLKRLLQRQPINMPLFLTQSWTSCYLLMCQALQRTSSAFLVLVIETITAFLRPHHQQSPVAIDAIQTLIAAIKSKIPQLLGSRMSSSSALESSPTIDSCMDSPCQIALISLMDIVSSLTCLFNTNSVYCGNDISKVVEFHHLIEDTAVNLFQNQICAQNPLHVLSSYRRVEIFLSCLDSYLSFSCHEYQSANFPSQPGLYISNTYLPFTTQLLKCGIPWLVLKTASPYRNGTLEVHVSKFLMRVFLPQMKDWSLTLQINPDDLLSGFTQLEWHENFSTIPHTREGILASILMLHFSIFNGFRPLPKKDLQQCLHQILYQIPSILTWKPIMLKSFAFLTAMSEHEENQNDQSFQYESLILQEMEKTSVELWYTESTELLKWTVSSPPRATTVGKLMVEYWLHQLALDEKKTTDKLCIVGQEEFLCSLQGNFAFLSVLVKLLGSHTIGYIARIIFLHIISQTESDLTTERKSMWGNLLHDINQTLDSAFPLASEVNELTIQNTIPILMTLMLKEWDLNKSWLYSVKSVTRVAKYLSSKERSLEEYKNGIGFLSVLTGHLITQESKTVIPPLMQNIQFVSLVNACLRSTDACLVSYTLSLCSWISVHGASFQALQPLVISSSYLMSSLVSCKRGDILLILRLINSALRLTIPSQNSSGPGSIIFTQTGDSSLYNQSIFTIAELHQLFIYAQQNAAQDNKTVQIEAVDLMENIMSQGSYLRKQLIHHPWNVYLMEMALNSHTESTLTDLEARLSVMFSSTQDTENAECKN